MAITSLLPITAKGLFLGICLVGLLSWGAQFRLALQTADNDKEYNVGPSEVGKVTRNETRLSSDTTAPTTRTPNNKTVVATSAPSIAYISFSFMDIDTNFKRFDQMVMSALRTWVPADSSYFVVLTQQSKSILEEYCRQESLHILCQRLHPISVDCPEGAFGESPCCKQQEGLLYMLEQFPTQFDWYVFSDDDILLRHDYLTLYLSDLDATSLIVASHERPPHKRLGQAGYLSRQDTQYQCDYTYPWGQPVIYSGAALHHLQSGLRNHGLVHTCRVYNVTHDVGNAIFHWIYGLRVVKLPYITPRPGVFRYEYMGAHGIGRPRLHGRRKRIFDMNTVYQVYTSIYDKDRNDTSVKFPPPPYNYTWFDPEGYNTTSTFRIHGHPTSWKEETWQNMPVSDCLRGS